MKKILLMLTVLTLGSHAEAWAQDNDYAYLVFEVGDDKTAVSLDSLTLTITDGLLTATNVQGVESFVLSTLSRMYFSVKDATRIMTPQVSDNEMTPPVYYDLQGRKIAIPIKGVYIMKKGSNTRKVIVR